MVARGVSSFCAEANNLGIKVTAFDPIYSLSREKIRERSGPDLESVYPTVTSEAQSSEYIPMLQSDAALQAFEFTETESDFEFLVNSNSYLRIMRVQR